MKLRPNLTQHQTFEEEKKEQLIKPKPPTQQAIQKAKFVDKSFAWRNDARLRS
tara:strand:- start:917 stop:1075 length:159 start_codon:yes stop_codon:yes gene_type:complete